MTVLPARLHGIAPTSNPREQLVIIDDPSGQVRVRLTLGKAKPWRCDLCGLQAKTDCAHTFSAGLLLAEKLLGLTRVDDLQPERTPA